MTAIRLTEAFTDRVIHVSAEQRVADAIPHGDAGGARYAAVFDSGRYLGTVELSGGTLTSPQRIFFDALRLGRLPSASREDSPHNIARLLDESSAGGVAIVDAQGAFVGVVCRYSLMQVMLDKSRRQVAEIERMRKALDEEGSRLRHANASHDRLLRTIRRVQTDLETNSNPQSFYEKLLEHVLELSGSGIGFIGDVLVSDAGQAYLKIRALSNIAWSEETLRLYERNLATGLDFHDLDNLLGAAITSREAVIANEPATHPYARGFPVGHPHLDNFLAMPLFDAGELIGMVGLANRPEGYTQESVQYLEPLLQTFATMIRAYWKTRRTQIAEAKFRGILESSPDGVIITDDRGIIGLANSRVSELFGYAPEELVGQPVELMLPAQLRDRHVMLRDAYFASPHSRAMGQAQDLIAQRRNGERFPVELSLTPVHTPEGLFVAVVVRDVTDAVESRRKLAWDALKSRLIHEATMLASETEDFEHALRGCVDCVRRLTNWRLGHVYVPAPDGRAVLLPTGIFALARNDLFLEFRRATLATEFAMGKGLPGRIWESGRAEWIPNVQTDDNFPRARLCHEIGVKGAFGFPIMVNGGVVAVLEFFAEQELEPDEELLQTVTVVGEQVGRILERKLATEALFQKSEQLREAQKLESIGTLAGGVAHEFNNLLQVISGHAGFALGELPPGQPACDDLKQVLKASDHAAALTRQLLGFSRRDAIQRGVHHPNQIVGELLGMLRPLLGEQIEVSTELDPLVAPIPCDAGQLKHVLLNLCINARDAMPDGGTLTIGTRNAGDGPPSPDSADNAPYGWVVLSVRDTGTGIPPEILSRVFDPFFTTKETGKGTGLGLSLAYGIVQQHRGTIRVESEPGTGTTFRLFLPAAEHAEHRPMDDSCRKDASTRGGRETVLIGEDDDAVRRISVRILTSAGYEVIEATTGAEAVRAFEEHASRIALVLLDVVMPEMSGRAAYDRIQRIRPGTPALFCTGYDPASRHAVGRAEPAGHVRLLQKPFDRDALLTAVRELLEEQDGQSAGIADEGTGRRAPSALEWNSTGGALGR